MLGSFCTLQERCSTQIEQIRLLEQQLAAANEKLKVAKIVLDIFRCTAIYNLHFLYFYYP